MRITVMGVVVLIGGVLLAFLILNQLSLNPPNTNQNPNQ